MTVLAFWSFVTKAMECLVRWSVIINTGTMVGVVCKLSSLLTSMKVKSMWTKSRGAVAIMGCNSSFDELNSCLMHFWQFFTAFLTSEGIFSHHNLSAAKDSEWFCP